MYLQPYIESLIEKSCLRGKMSCTEAALAEVVPRSAECSRSFVSMIDVLVLGETKKGKSAFDLKFPFPVMFPNLSKESASLPFHSGCVRGEKQVFLYVIYQPWSCTANVIKKVIPIFKYTIIVYR